MATSTYRIQASVDDTYLSTSLGNLYTNSQVSLGHGAGGPDHTTYLRWSLDLPERAIISEATIQVRVTTLNYPSTAPNGSIRLIDSDSCPSLDGDVGSLTVVGPAVAWDTTDWKVNKWAYSLDISAWNWRKRT